MQALVPPSLRFSGDQMKPRVALGARGLTLDLTSCSGRQGPQRPISAGALLTDSALYRPAHHTVP
jgi:hypothetical protein